MIRITLSTVRRLPRQLYPQSSFPYPQYTSSSSPQILILYPLPLLARVLLSSPPKSSTAVSTQLVPADLDVWWIDNCERINLKWGSSQKGRVVGLTAWLIWMIQQDRRPAGWELKMLK